MSKSNPNRLINVLRKTRARHSFLQVKKVATAVALVEQIGTDVARKYSKTVNSKCINGSVKVVIYGSYMLNSATTDSDLDLLVVIPSFIFTFQFLCDFHREIKNCSEFTDAIYQHTSINIIMAKYKKIKVDMTFARFPKAQLPQEIHFALTDEVILEAMDAQSRGIVESYLTTNAICQVSESNPIFTSTLRAVKHWAKCRSIYANIFGFFNGVSLAIMVARVYRKFKCKNTEELFEQFFRYYAGYNWSVPVTIEESDVDDQTMYNPMFKRMRIIIPTESARNASERITLSHSYIIQTEFIRAVNICNSIVRKGICWSRLFDPAEFFNCYDYFIVIVTCCPDEHLGRVKCDAKGLATGLESLEEIKYSHFSNIDYEVSKLSKYNFDYPNVFVKVLWAIAVVPDSVNPSFEEVEEIVEPKMASFDRFARLPLCNLGCMLEENFTNCVNIFLATRKDIKDNVRIEKLKYKLIIEENIVQPDSTDQQIELGSESDESIDEIIPEPTK